MVMLDTFNIQIIKNKRGIFAGILPRESGKTTAIIKSMERGDYYLSPVDTHDIVKYWNKDNIIKCTRRKIVTANSKNFLFYKQPSSGIFRGHSINTLFIDEFLLYDIRRIEYILYYVFPASKNIILVSSNGGGVLPSIMLRSYDSESPNYFIRPHYYDKITFGNNNIISLPDTLFEL